ncbi:MAG: ribonuclease III [Oscillospiraceae bacterium]|nr:ribonuclease III [Oscillospiraceae bacterium]
MNQGGCIFVASEFEQKLGYTFRNQSLLQNALTHSSYANEHKREGMGSNERLEFLGDAILGVVVAEHLYKTYPDKPEGELTKLRAELVCEKNLAEVAKFLDLGSVLRLGHGESHGGGSHRPSMLADAVEAVLAASYLDGGMDVPRALIHRLILQKEAAAPSNQDYKTRFQELVQRAKDQVIAYTLVGSEGPDHAKTFRVEVSLNGQCVGVGTGSSKKRAEQDAAHAAINRLYPNE